MDRCCGWDAKSIPQGLKPHSLRVPERAKPEGLAYLEARARLEARVAFEAE
jgi:hypothetical protein